MVSRGFHSIEEVVDAQLCHGCGACSTVCTTKAVQLVNFTDVGIRPVVEPSQCTQCHECVSVCSAVNLKHSREEWGDDFLEVLGDDWGPVLEVWEGHSGDQEIRFRGGSGGGATALGLYAIERQGMHGVLHVGMDSDRPWLNRTVMSTSREQLLGGTGSRYAPAAVCAELNQIAGATAPCVLVGKPCDIASASLAARKSVELANNLGIKISIFCGGTPSSRGVLAVLKQLGVKAEDVESMRFRGHGWPGMTGVNLRSTSDGSRIEMTYHEAWDSILTKYKPLRCQICPDGTGEFADISCGDPWYRKPEANELGSTLFLIRTQKGREFFHEAMRAGFIVAEQRSADVLAKSQVGLLMRRSHIWPKMLAAKVLGLPFPRYEGFGLFKGFIKNLRPLRIPVALFRALKAAWGLKRRTHLGPTDGEPIVAGKQSIHEKLQ